MAAGCQRRCLGISRLAFRASSHGVPSWHCHSGIAALQHGVHSARVPSGRMYTLLVARNPMLLFTLSNAVLARPEWWQYKRRGPHR